MSKTHKMKNIFKAAMVAAPLMVAPTTANAASATLVDNNGRAHTQSGNCRDFMVVSNVLYMTNEMAAQLDPQIGQRLVVNNKQNDLKALNSLEEVKEMSSSTYDYIQKNMTPGSYKKAYKRAGQFTEQEKVIVAKVRIANAIEAALRTHLVKNHNISEPAFKKYTKQFRANCTAELNL